MDANDRTLQLHGLLQLSGCALENLINRLSTPDLAALRASAHSVQAGIDPLITSATISSFHPKQLATLLLKLRGLKELTLAFDGGGIHALRYAELQADIPALVAALSGLTTLTSLELSLAAASHLGALKWSYGEAQMAADEAGFNEGRRRATAPAQRPSPLERVLHVPDWLASAPRLQQLTVCGPNSIVSVTDSSRRVWLWLQPQVWSSQLTCLQFTGVQLCPASTAPASALSQLTALQRLVVCGTVLQPAAVYELLRQLQGCPQLTSLALASSMCPLPEQGWEGLTGLKELDVSQQVLMTLPAGLSCLSALTSLQVHHNALHTLPQELSALSNMVHLAASHNWLAGGSSCLPGLLAAWPHLAVLELDNVSDKRGALVLPPGLADCKQLRELSIRDNYSVDWAALLAVVPNCKGLRLLRLGTDSPADCLKDLAAVQPAGLTVSLE